jgi:hypothetical protein
VNVSILEEVLVEEHVRSERVSRALTAELAGLPRGSVRERTINGRPYYYLQYREGSHVRSDYVPREDVEALREGLARRKEVVAALKEQERSRRQIEKALGRGFADEHAGA